jgi:hypothetical protein
MVSGVMTVAVEVVVACEMALGAALVLVWVAIEAIGYGGLLYRLALNQRWVVLRKPPKPARDIRWGTAVRAAGLQTRRLSQTNAI